MKKTAVFLSLILLFSSFISISQTTKSTSNSAENPKVEVVFVLDCTGSMSSLIQTAKEKIWSIATNLTQAEPAPDIMIGLVGYRDKGDAFISKISQLTDNLDNVYSELMSFAAEGGGDGPESVNQGLYDAVNLIEWTNDHTSYKTIFLVGDYPPHMDYQDDVKYQESCKQASKKGIIINTIQMGNYGPTTPIWKEIASLTDGEFILVDQSANGIAITTPYDDKIVEKSKELDKTRLYYGSKKEKEAAVLKSETEEKIYEGASSSSIARRAVFNVSESGAKNFSGSNELIQAIENGSVKLDELKNEELPTELQTMTKEQQEEFVNQKLEERELIKAEIKTLEEQRQAYIEEELEKMDDKGENSFSEKIYSTVKTQAKTKNINYSGSTKH